MKAFVDAHSLTPHMPVRRSSAIKADIQPPTSGTKSTGVAEVTVASLSRDGTDI